MECKNNKRNRSSNWSESEKTLLTALIKEKIHLIENKDVTKNNNDLKKAAWQDVLQSFNQINDIKRDLPQLINQWRNTKNNIKRRDCAYRRNCNATGGGPRPPSPPPEDMEIMAMIPKEFEIDENIYDSDSLNIKKDKVSKEKITTDQPVCSMIKCTLPLQPTQIENRTADQPGCSMIKCTSSLPLKPTEIEIINADQPSSTVKYTLPVPLQPTEIVSIPSNRMRDEKQGKINYIKKNTKANKRKITPDKSEQEIFLLAKSVRIKQIEFQEAEHKRKIEIMEEEHKIRLEILKKELLFWEKKLAD